MFDTVHQLPRWTNGESSAKVKGLVRFTTALTLITKVIMREGGTENMPEAMDVVEQKSTMCVCVRALANVYMYVWRGCVHIFAVRTQATPKHTI